MSWNLFFCYAVDFYLVVSMLDIRTYWNFHIPLNSRTCAWISWWMSILSFFFSRPIIFINLIQILYPNPSIHPILQYELQHFLSTRHRLMRSYLQSCQKKTNKLLRGKLNFSDWWNVFLKNWIFYRRIWFGMIECKAMKKFLTA